jgi:DNA-binding winged helix-turn-helix (wHTH) protein
VSSERDSKRRRSVDHASGDAILIVDGGPRDGDVVTLAHGTSVLGRHDECDIVLDEAAASREHALIVEADAGYHLRDLSSTNGTFVNRHRLGGELHLLRHGDILHFGANTISYRFHHSRASTLQLSTVDAAPDAVMVDAKARHVYVEGQKLDPPVPRKEFDLLMLLDSKRGEAISRDEISIHVWPEQTDGDVGNHEIEQCVRRVRVRIEQDPSNPRFLLTVRGFGYKLV